MFLFAKTIESVHAFANKSDIYEFYNTTYHLAAFTQLTYTVGRSLSLYLSFFVGYIDAMR